MSRVIGVELLVENGVHRAFGSRLEDFGCRLDYFTANLVELRSQGTKVRSKSKLFLARVGEIRCRLARS